jgi:Flp pilus assembly protein TadG
MTRRTAVRNHRRPLDPRFADPSLDAGPPDRPASERTPASPVRSRRGQALVEFALVLPIFFLVLAGILDFGFMLFSRMSVINAAREGARAAAMTADDTTIPTVVASRVSAAAAKGGITVDSSNVTLACLQTTSASYNPSTSTPACTWTLYKKTTNPGGAQPGDSVSVTVSYTYHSFFPLFFGSSLNLTSTVQMVLDNVTTG